MFAFQMGQELPNLGLGGAKLHTTPMPTPIPFAQLDFRNTTLYPFGKMSVEVQNPVSGTEASPRARWYV